VLDIALLNESDSCAEKHFTVSEVAASWLAWVSDTAAHYTAVDCPRRRTTGPVVQPADIPPLQSAAL